MRVQIFLVGATLLVVLAFIGLFLRLRLRKVPPGQALLITGSRGRRRVSFGRAVVIPIIERADFIDISTRTLVIEPEPSELMITSDNQHLAYQAHFYLRINKTAEDVQQVADALGCERASDPDVIEQLFRPKLVSAMRLVAHQLPFKELQDDRQLLQDRVLEEIGRDLNGFQLVDLVIDRIEPAKPDTTGPFR